MNQDDYEGLVIKLNVIAALLVALACALLLYGDW